MLKQAKKDIDEISDYRPTAREREALPKALRVRKENPATRPKDSKRGRVNRVSSMPQYEETGYTLLLEALGTTDSDFTRGILSQLVRIGSVGPKLDEQGINFVFSVVSGVEPKDKIEAMLAAQMAAVHVATMKFANHLAHADNVPLQDSAERAFNNLARTFTTQMQALKRYRTGGEQKVTVQHVNVGEDGQATVGSVTQQSRQIGAENTRPAAATTDAMLEQQRSFADREGKVAVLRRVRK